MRAHELKTHTLAMKRAHARLQLVCAHLCIDLGSRSRREQVIVIWNVFLLSLITTDTSYRGARAIKMEDRQTNKDRVKYGVARQLKTHSLSCGTTLFPGDSISMWVPNSSVKKLQNLCLHSFSLSIADTLFHTFYYDLEIGEDDSYSVLACRHRHINVTHQTQ